MPTEKQIRAWRALGVTEVEVTEHGYRLRLSEHPLTEDKQSPRPEPVSHTLAQWFSELPEDRT